MELRSRKPRWLLLGVLAVALGSGCSSSTRMLSLSLERERRPIIQIHERFCRGAANPVDRLKSNPKEGRCPLCQF